MASLPLDRARRLARDIVADSVPFSCGCACGAIRYEYTAEPITMFNCHCRDCQRATGTAFSAVVDVPAKAFTITKGSPRYYSTLSEVVGVTTSVAFAPNAVRDSSADAAMRGNYQLQVLDDPSRFRPQFDIFTSDAQPWGVRRTRSCQSLRNIRHLKALDG